MPYPAAAARMPHMSEDMDLLANEQDTAAGRRKIKMIWEITHAAVVLIVVITTMAVAVHRTVFGGPQLPTTLTGGFFMVVAFYFSRTFPASRKRG